MLSRSLTAPLSRAFHASAGRQVIQTVNVPSMGDSISEGTLVEILKTKGDSVHADEVVLVLETDKVSVDVTSPVAGTIVEVLAQLEDSVEVGKPLFTLDDALVPATLSKSTQAPIDASSEYAPAAENANVPSLSRMPLIKFLGKRSLLPAKPSKTPTFNSPLLPQCATSIQPSSVDVLSFHNVKRVPLSPSEVESINSGLAYL